MEEIKEKELTEKNKQFCMYYLSGFGETKAYNQTQSYLKVYDCSYETAMANSSKLLSDTKIKEYIKELQNDLSLASGISPLRVLREWESIAFGSMAALHNTWMDRKDFETLTNEQKACIAEIKTKSSEFGDEVLIKLYSKEKALENISKLLGFNEPDKTDITTDGESLNEKPDFSNLTNEEVVIYGKLKKKAMGFDD